MQRSNDQVCRDQSAAEQHREGIHESEEALTRQLASRQRIRAQKRHRDVIKRADAGICDRVPVSCPHPFIDENAPVSLNAEVDRPQRDSARTDCRAGRKRARQYVYKRIQDAERQNKRYDDADRMKRPVAF